MQRSTNERPRDRGFQARELRRLVHLYGLGLDDDPRVQAERDGSAPAGVFAPPEPAAAPVPVSVNRGISSKASSIRGAGSALGTPVADASIDFGSESVTLPPLLVKAH